MTFFTGLLLKYKFLGKNILDEYYLTRDTAAREILLEWYWI